MGEIRCFLVTAQPRARVSLRRFTYVTDEACPADQYGHGAVTWMPDEVEWTDLESNGRGGPPDDYPKDHPSWPTICEACGYQFQGRDIWQENYSRVFAAPDGREWVMRDLPPGAMLFGTWDPRARVTPALFLALPPRGGMNLWCIDGPASGGAYWDRTGEPPEVTVEPSILTGDYHGWLRAGVLVEC